MKESNSNISEAINLARKLMFLADKGDLQREDESCGVLYGIIRDCAYRIKAEAQKERSLHEARGVWESEEG
jgi:hypothetical protein